MVTNKGENMYRIKMLCYDEQNQAPYEDVSLECYKTEQDAKNAAIRLQYKRFQS